MSHSARASWERSLIPVRRPSSSVSSAATIRPSSRANATRSVRYSSPVVGDGRRSPIRRRSHAASIAYRPALISEIWRSSSVASLSSTIRSTVPPSLRTTRPRPVGSMASTETRAIAAWSRPRSSSSVDRSSGLDQRDVARHDQDLLDAVGERLEGRPQARRPCRVARPGAPRRRAPRRRRARPRWPASRRRRAALPVAPVAASSTYSIIGRPQTGCRTLGIADFMRVPRPAARTTATVRRSGEPGLEGVTGSGARAIASGSPLVVRLRRRPRVWVLVIRSGADSAGGPVRVSTGAAARRPPRPACAADLGGVIVRRGRRRSRATARPRRRRSRCACPCAAHSASVRRSRRSAVVERAAASASRDGPIGRSS